MAQGKSYRIVNPDGKESNVSEAIVEVYKGKAKQDPEGWAKFRIIGEIDRGTGEIKEKGGRPSGGDRAAT